jgi:fibronectin-binding autotransporter adhesin
MQANRHPARLGLGPSWRGSSNGTLGSGSVVDNAALAFSPSGTATIGNAISGSGTVTQAYGTLIVTGANTYSGGTTIALGATLQVGNGGTSGTLGSGEVTCVYEYPYYPAGQLAFNRSNTITVDNDISGFLSVVQQGSGALVLTGSNTYTQGTTINSGKTLRIGSNDSDVLPNGEGSGTVTVNGTLDLNGYGPSVGGLSGSGTVTSGVSGNAVKDFGSRIRENSGLSW